MDLTDTACEPIVVDINGNAVLRGHKMRTSVMTESGTRYQTDTYAYFNLARHVQCSPEIFFQAYKDVLLPSVDLDAQEKREQEGTMQRHDEEAPCVTSKLRNYRPPPGIEVREWISPMRFLSHALSLVDIARRDAWHLLHDNRLRDVLEIPAGRALSVQSYWVRTKAREVCYEVSPPVPAIPPRVYIAADKNIAGIIAKYFKTLCRIEDVPEETLSKALQEVLRDFAG